MAEYPEDFQKAMAEEIGWRVGSEAGLDPAKIIAMADRLAQSSRPRFVHGACRSAWHPGVALAALKRLLSALDDESASQCLTAVGFALAQVGQTNAQVAALGADLGNADWAGVLVTAHSGFEGTEQGWLNPDLGRPSQAR